MNIINSNLKFKSLTYGNVPKAIVLHNADSSNCTIQDIHQWHLNNGWAGCGYHYFVRKDGSIYKGRPDGAIGSHCKGNNANTLGICFEGKYMTETMPDIQYNAGINLIRYLFSKYGVMLIYGHKELFATDCPGSKFPLADFKSLLIKKGEWLKGKSKGNTDKWWYKYSNGAYPKNEWVKLPKSNTDNTLEWFYFDKEGWMQTGWVKWKGKDYYCYSNGIMAHDCTLWGTYRFNSDGVATKIK